MDDVDKVVAQLKKEERMLWLKVAGLFLKLFWELAIVATMIKVWTDILTW